MLDIAAELTRWCDRGEPFAVATVVAVSGSAPREPGAALAVNGAGEAIGSVSGGCVESAVYALCQEVLDTGRPTVGHFGYSTDDAFAVGLTCGGTIDVIVERVDPTTGTPLAAALAAVAAGQRCALLRVVTGPETLRGKALFLQADGTATGGFGDPALDDAARAETRAFLDLGRTGTIEVGAEGGLCGEPVTLLLESSVPPPRMLVFGAIDYAAALAQLGAFLGYRVTVCDARPVFATRNRFPHATEVVVDWPHRYLATTDTDARTVVCVLTHDAKFDVPLLQQALRMPVAYVGVMGSRRTHQDRLSRLREAGLGKAELARMRSPIGLDLGARTPEETAVSIASEIVACLRGGGGAPLADGHAPIHGNFLPPRARAGTGRTDTSGPPDDGRRTA
ncbi:XshC-Cox1-family protein [Streptomyces hygroscopicus]|uniref:XdhC family protein n=1 Tax=Streptomyces hygroscopicus TaxID=1912 RepID=UPI002240A7A9|nr:XdhC/CoxI family protein [Streptomyces hygroscopicus]MCW7945719.1 XshC-Cox1-family protein [Streptomyces hygroscopicus]